MPIRFEFTQSPGPILDNLSNKMKTAIQKKALRAACKPLRSIVKAVVPQRSGALKMSISTLVKQKNYVAFGVVGASRRINYDGNVPANYLHLVNQGSGKVTLKNKLMLFGHEQFWGLTRPAIQGKHLLERTWSGIKDFLSGVLIQTIREEVSKTLPPK
jgi:hypothetical protein